MRAVCFVKRLEFELSGNILQNALALGDVDNDGHNELVVCNQSGDMAIFKGDKLWQRVGGLGMIAAVGIGDIFNLGYSAVVVVSGDGWCHIFLRTSVEGASESIDQKKGKLESVHVQRIPANTKVILLGDIDGDGCTEVVLGLTDRVVRSYRWVHHTSEDEALHPFSGNLVGLNKWECANQIGAVTLNYSLDGKPCLLVAQPGGTFMKIHCQNEVHSESTESDVGASTLVDYHPLSCSRMRNPNVSTKVLGCIRCEEPKGSSRKSMRYAVATLDGTLMLVQDEEVLWSIQVDHQLSALTKLDITGDGRDEIVACSWDGQTYILDQEKRSVRFQLEESVCAFCSGFYSLSTVLPPAPCFVYTTFTNKIYLYYDVKLTSMVAQSIGRQLDLGEEHDGRCRQLITEWCLYGDR